MDMREPYKDIAVSFFPKALIVIDRYHYVRQVYWALDRVRKRVQKLFITTKRIYFKRSRRLLDADYDKLSEDDQRTVRVMVNQHADLYYAWKLRIIQRLPRLK